MKKIEQKWPGPRIIFAFLDCPECKQRIKAPHCPKIVLAIKEAENIEKVVVEKA